MQTDDLPVCLPDFVTPVRARKTDDLSVCIPEFVTPVRAEFYFEGEGGRGGGGRSAGGPGGGGGRALAGTGNCEEETNAKGMYPPPQESSSTGGSGGGGRALAGSGNSEEEETNSEKVSSGVPSERDVRGACAAIAKPLERGSGRGGGQRSSQDKRDIYNMISQFVGGGSGEARGGGGVELVRSGRRASQISSETVAQEATEFVGQEATEFVAQEATETYSSSCFPGAAAKDTAR